MQVTNRNLAFLYNSEEGIIAPSYKLFHTTDTLSELMFNVHSIGLLYKKNDTTAFFEAKYRLSYRIYESYESKVIVDSGSRYFKDVQIDLQSKRINNSVSLKIRNGKTGLLEVILSDLNKHTENTQFVPFNKSTVYNADNFYAKTMDAEVLYHGWIGKENMLKIYYRDSLLRHVYIKHYPANFPVALPPFVISDIAAIRIKYDTIYTVTKTRDCFEYNFMKKGIYLIQADTTKREGMPIIVFESDYPRLTTSESLLEPLRYLTSKTEFDKMKASSNAKAELDKFWLDIAVNPERAKEIIRRYYSNVQEANTYFTSYIDGWKTDRGMIFTVFGKPNAVYRTTEGETWIYGEEFNLNSLVFRFIKLNNPFTNNDYELNRSALFRQNWNNAVEIWRR